MRFSFAGSVLLLAITALSGAAAAQVCTPASADLVGWWQGEGDGLDIVDGHTVIVPEGSFIDFVNGKVGKAFTFDLSGGLHVRPFNNDRLGPAAGADFSVEAWIRPVSATGIQAIVDRRVISGNSTIGYTVYLNGNTLGVQLADGTFSNFTSEPLIGLTNGSFHHIAVTVDRDSSVGLRMYYDGFRVALFDPTARSGSLSDLSASFLIGQHATDGSLNFGGSIDEVSFYLEALTQSNVQAIYNAGSAGKCHPRRLFHAERQFTTNNRDSRYGESVAVNRSGTVMVIGNPGIFVAGIGNNVGRAEVYTLNSAGAWALTSTLLASDMEAESFFGSSVAIGEDGTIAVGAPLKDSVIPPLPDVGAVYVFNAAINNNIPLKFAIGGAHANDQYGKSVAVISNTIVVGAPYADTPGFPDAGRVYCYDFVAGGSNWTVTEFTSTPAGENFRFGTAVAIAADGKTVIATAPGENAVGAGSGSSHLFTRTQQLDWSPFANLPPHSFFNSDGRFGSSAAIDGNIIAIGAPGTFMSTHPGYVYLYLKTANGWNAMTPVLAGPKNHDSFGSSVAIRDGVLAVGAPFSASADDGLAYVFRFSNTVGAAPLRLQVISPIERYGKDSFGNSVALSRNGLLVIGSNFGGPNISGIVHTFTAQQRKIRPFAQNLLRPGPDNATPVRKRSQ